MPTDPSQIVESAGARYGLLGTISAVLLLGLIWFIRLYLQANTTIGREREAMVKEREQTIAREAALRAECKLEQEKARRELSEDFAKELSEHLRQSRDYEAQIRREFAEAQEALASEIAAMATRNNQTIDKLTERLLVQRQPSGRY